MISIPSKSFVSLKLAFEHFQLLEVILLRLVYILDKSLAPINGIILFDEEMKLVLLLLKLFDLSSTNS